jgi:alkylation response protein AidB-like acyl-CoA dehydrogenase
MDSETFSILHETVRRFVDERLMPNEDRLENDDAVPPEIIEEMKDLGLFGLTVPEEYGGLGLSMSEEIRVLFEMGRASFAYRSVFGTTVGIGSQGIVMDGTEEQKREWLPAPREGMIASFALTEPDAGSDAGIGARPARSGWRQLPPQRHQALYHQCAARGVLHGDGPQRARREGARAFPPSSCPPIRRASASARSTRRWARRVR